MAKTQGIIANKNAIFPKKSHRVKQTATPKLKEKRVVPKNFALSKNSLFPLQKTSVRELTNCFKLFVEKIVEQTKPYAPEKALH